MVEFLLGLLAIIVGDAYAAHLCLNPKQEALNAANVALGVEWRLAKKL